MNKIPIVMPIYNRPAYLKQVLDALKKCVNVDKFYIETFEENEMLGSSTTIEENAKVIKAVDWVEVRRNINAGVMGCAANVTQAIDSVCQMSDYFVVLEDDIVPAVDFFNLMLFGFKNLSEDIRWVQAYSLNPKEYLENEDLYNKLQRKQFFGCWGWGSSRELWLEFRKDFNVAVHPQGSWAIPLAIWLMKKQYFGYQSMIGRSQNIGELGTFQKDPQKHRAQVHNEYWYGFTNKIVDEFEILPKTKTEYGNPLEFKRYMNGIFGNMDYKKSFRNWENL